MKTFSEFTGNDTQAASMTAFPTFEEVAQGKDVASEPAGCLSDKLKDLIKEMCESGMMEMKSCHADESEMTAENWMSECDSAMEKCMESLKGCSEACMNA